MLHDCQWFLLLRETPLMATKKLRFTKAALEALRPPVKSHDTKGGIYDTYRDARVKGVVLVVSNGGAKTFYLYCKVGGTPQRIKLGAFPDISIEQARKLAAQKRAQIIAGLNPNQEKRKLKAETTFGELFQLYLHEHAKPKLRSWQHSERRYQNHLLDWQNKKLSTLTREEVRKRFQRITADKGGYAANATLSLISKMFAIAIERGWDGANPAQGIKKNREQARDRFIQGDEFSKFFKAVMEEPNETARDYFLLSLFCGQRKSNMLAMRWDEIDFSNRTWRIPDTKNGEPQTVGLTEPALQILNRRKKQAAHQKIKPTWVFPSPSSESGHFEEPKSAWKRILQRAQIQNLRIHDIRRTMGSYMAMGGAGQYLIGKALGHKSSAATEIYARVAVDPVREAQEQAAKRMLELMAGNG